MLVAASAVAVFVRCCSLTEPILSSTKSKKKALPTPECSLWKAAMENDVELLSSEMVLLFDHPEFFRSGKKIDLDDGNRSRASNIANRDSFRSYVHSFIRMDLRRDYCAKGVLEYVHTFLVVGSLRNYLWKKSEISTTTARARRDFTMFICSYHHT